MEEAAQLPEAEHCGHEQECENRDRGECGHRNDHALHAVSVPGCIAD
jgi:hypothetical protein